MYHQSKNSSFSFPDLLNRGFLMTLNNPAFPILGPALFNTDSRLFPLLQVRHLSSGEGWAVLLYGWRLPPELCGVPLPEGNARDSGPQTFLVCC